MRAFRSRRHGGHRPPRWGLLQRQQLYLWVVQDLGACRTHLALLQAVAELQQEAPIARRFVDSDELRVATEAFALTRRGRGRRAPASSARAS